MRRIKNLFFLNGLNEFKIIKDEYDTEYVVFQDSQLDCVIRIKDKTEFEALENHRHILDNISVKEFELLVPVAESVGDMLLCCLRHKFPEKSFVVFVSLHVHDSFIIRFHQKWKNEEYYYDPNDFDSQTEKVFMFEN